eukprot:TRINITY_DN40610_c0_g1_i1.p1 TRINITY_DN40610_c0_g1~~TRINITY_DN40610_c0_g1_i1.p1  ORF type:complete len:840 (+),score=165.78 TRINITY_DN40610_c0_g1_i1:67-2586(+)
MVVTIKAPDSSSTASASASPPTSDEQSVPGRVKTTADGFCDGLQAKEESIRRRAFRLTWLRRRTRTTSANGLEKAATFVYDAGTHVDVNRTSRSGLILLDGPEAEDAVPSHVLRCFSDWRVLLADFVMLASVLGTCATAPLCFIWGGSWQDTSQLPWGRQLLYFDAAFDVVFALHLLFRLRVSYLTEKRRAEVVDLDRILRHHYRNPVYWLLWLGVLAHPLNAVFGVPFLVVNNFKALRPLKHFLFLPDSLWDLKEQLAVRLSVPVIMLVIGAHWAACVLSNLGGILEVAVSKGRAADFATSFRGSRVSPWVSLYVMAFVDSIYMLTGSLDNPLGDGGVREKQFGALLIVAVCGPLGCVAVSFLISVVVREQATFFALDAKHQENKALICKALANLGIPENLKKRVLGLHEFQKMGHDWQAFDALFNEKNVSPPLALALKVFLYQDSVLLNSTYFFEKDTNYVLEVVSVLEDQIYLPGDFVIRRGQVGGAMFFVVRGTLTVLVPDSAHKERSIHFTKEVGKKLPGDHFGEIALVQDCVRTAWVRASQYVHVAMFTREHAEAIWKHYPWERAKLVEAAVEVARRDRERAATWASNATLTAKNTTTTNVTQQGTAPAVTDSNAPGAGRDRSEAVATTEVLDAEAFGAASNAPGAGRRLSGTLAVTPKTSGAGVIAVESIEILEAEPASVALLNLVTGEAQAAKPPCLGAPAFEESTSCEAGGPPPAPEVLQAQASAVEEISEQLAEFRTCLAVVGGIPELAKQLREVRACMEQMGRDLRWSAEDARKQLAQLQWRQGALEEALLSHGGKQEAARPAAEAAATGDRLKRSPSISADTPSSME